MRNENRLIVHFIVSRLHILRDKIIPLDPGEAVKSFVNKNKSFINAITESAKSIYTCEISNEQINMAVRLYYAPPCQDLESLPKTMHDEFNVSFKKEFTPVSCAGISYSSSKNDKHGHNK